MHFSKLVKTNFHYFMPAKNVPDKQPARNKTKTFAGAMLSTQHFQHVRQPSLHAGTLRKPVGN